MERCLTDRMAPQIFIFSLNFTDQVRPQIPADMFSGQSGQKMPHLSDIHQTRTSGDMDSPHHMIVVARIALSSTATVAI